MKIRSLSAEKHRLFWELGRRDGKRQQKTEVFHGSRRAAERHWRDVQAQIDQHRLVAPVAYTMGDLWQRWVQDVLPLKNVKETTRFQYQRHWTRYVAPVWQEQLVSTIQSEDIQRWITALYEAGGHQHQGLSRSTVQLLYLLLKMPLDQAEAWGWIPRSPARPKRIILPSLQSTPKRIWTMEEGRRFLSQGRTTRLFPVYALAMLTGLRLGEMLSLQWGDIDWEHHLITVQRTWSQVGPGHYKLEAPKREHSYRVVPWPDNFDPVFQAWSERQRIESGSTGQPGSWVFTTKTGQPLRMSSVQQQLPKLCQSIGITRISFHGLRHSYASWLIEAGIPITVVRDLLGHIKSSTTADIYVHSSLTGKIDATQHIMRQLFSS